MAEPITITVAANGSTRVQLFLKVEPKFLPGQLELIGQANERTIRQLLAGYDLSVVALPDVVGPVDRLEGTVDLNPDQAAERIMQPIKRELIEPAALVARDDWHVVTPTSNKWRQQAAAILIAIIALLTALVPLVK